MVNELTRHIAAKIKRDGLMSFDRFMRHALYDERHGYYRAGVDRSRDYITSPRVHPAFGMALAHFLEELRKLVGTSSPFTTVEIGAGDGLLAKQIVPNLSKNHRYIAADIAPGQAANGIVAGLDSVPESVSGCVLSNELLDAFPVRRFNVVDGALRELYIAADPEGGLTTVLDAPFDGKIYQRLGQLLNTMPDGHCGEACFELKDWADLVARTVRKGYVVTIDYGREREILYSKYPNGTFVCARQHAENDDFLRAIGEQDMTAFVDFCAVDEALGAHGFTKVFETSQAELLERLGLKEFLWWLRRQRLPQAEFVRHSAAVNKLLDEDGLGGFRIVVHARNAPTPPRDWLERCAADFGRDGCGYRSSIGM